MKKTGTTLREIRENAMLSATKFYRGILSLQYAYRVEANTQLLSKEKMNELLDRHNMLIDEFYFVQRDYKLTELEEILYEFFQMKSTLDVKKMQSFVQTIDDKLADRENQFYENLKQIMLAYIDFNKTQNIESIRSVIQVIWIQLAKKNQWSYCELVLMCNVVFVFELDDLESMIKRLFKELNRYQQFKNIDELQVKAWFNYCTILRINGRMKETKTLLRNALERSIILNNGFLIYECKFRLYELDWVENEIEHREVLHDQVQRIIDALHLMEREAEAIDLVQDWKKRTGTQLKITGKSYVAAGV
ncbi:hypothetical protein [Listeria booriae]|uniref:Transcriptional regulator n=2 Tax=Listeria booriae TaxID=1552123 RepID=A0A7X1BWC8_9LIST|nr:hypothetical protein [Listeria booriae]MBC1248235.1 hypothetical protein [Listeria booriae]MBC1333611.1 hypothetical protein [Listeria booriae]MBC2022594.1 hypothetical protein [Listeria booriae]